ncbi:hypothetical protein SCL_2013 [Sulfuricaulis limicola]|uniref:SpoOJ/ParA/ParB/repB family protein n=1 Tax=Sulfuricaulis limicola TaxID=1620215 RepID=A0A1B4XHM5_9GAMM|nr:DUF1015 domain-containing protein [Sulfuricaulis limicola]BAV34304.1 hypothetical protein SCL_2013 [Sulfuricaulis limicola]
MSLIRPFTGLRPAPRLAAEVIAPPYDVLNTEEARARAQGRPWSFLHISKPEIDLPAGTDPHSAAVYAKGRENFEKMLKANVLGRDPEPCYYVYRLVMGAHRQTGIVAAAAVPDYDSNRIRKHEFTRPDKEDDRVRQIEALNAQTGPVFLTYRRSSAVDAIIDQVTPGTPDVDITADDGVRHTLWVMRDQAQQDAITGLFDAMDCLYIADGHHRSAAASRVAAARKKANPKHTGEESSNYFLAVIFPDNQMQILDYNRVVKDLNGLTREAFLQKIEAAFNVRPESTMVKPGRTGEFGLYLKGQWYRLNIKPERIPANDPVKRLDVSLLQENLISPVLGIADPRRDKRIDFVGGIRGLKELERRVDSGEMACAFALFPTSIADMMAVADAGQVMPPKSTWFEPKLADGLVSHVLD